MAASPLFAGAVSLEVATLTSPTPITARTNITGTTGLTQLTATSTLGKRIDTITVKGKATNSSSNVSIWLYNGTTSFLLTEIDLPATTASNTVDSVEVSKYFTNGLNLSPTQQLFVSVTVAADINVFAMGGTY